MHSDSSLPHRSQVGGRSQGVPANRRVTTVSEAPGRRRSAVSSGRVGVTRLEGDAQVGPLGVEEPQVVVEVVDVGRRPARPASSGRARSAGPPGRSRSSGQPRRTRAIQCRLAANRFTASSTGISCDRSRLTQAVSSMLEQDRLVLGDHPLHPVAGDQVAVHQVRHQLGDAPVARARAGPAPARASGSVAA